MLSAIGTPGVGTAAASTWLCSKLARPPHDATMRSIQRGPSTTIVPAATPWPSVNSPRCHRTSVSASARMTKSSRSPGGRRHTSARRFSISSQNVSRFSADGTSNRIT